MSVYEDINAGKYENKVAYDVADPEPDKTKVTAAEYETWQAGRRGRKNAQRQLWQAENDRLARLFQADLEAEHGLTGHPKAAMLFGIAWERGHSSGYTDVANVYDEISQLLKP